MAWNRRRRALLLSLICLAWAARTTVARAGGYAAKILAAASEDEKGQAAIRGRRQGIDASNVMELVKRERTRSVVALVVGMYLEKGEFEGTKTLAVLKAFAARKGMAGKAAVMAACSPHLEKILKDLVATRSSRTLAALVVATYAHAEAVAAELGDPRGAKGKKKKRKKAGKRQGQAAGAALPDVDIEPFVKRLLADRSAAVRELAVLAAAYGGLDGLGGTIARLKTAGAPGLAAARLLYLARGGQELPEETARKVLAVRVPVAKACVRLSPLLHSYSIRGNALLYACQAVGAAGDERFAGRMHELLDHKDLRVQFEAARAIEGIASAESVPPLLKKLEGKPPWPVKVAVLSALGAIPARESVAPLLKLLAEEKGRFRQDAAYALASVCPPMAKLHIIDWARWWDEHGESFKVDAEATREFRRTHRVQEIAVEALVEFYGGKVVSNRAVFVLDTSMSMRGEKIKALKSNTAAMLDAMPSHMRFNIVDFGGIIRAMKSGSLIGARHRDHAKQLVGYMELSLGTRTFDAMEAATHLPGMDTIVYLSDGAPVGGQFEAWPRIVRAFDVYNRYRPVAIHCILYAPQGAKGGGGKGRAGGMRQLADHNAGIMTVAGEGDAAPPKR